MRIDRYSAGLYGIEQNFCRHSILFKGGDVTVQLIHMYSSWKYISASICILNYRERDDEGERLSFPLPTHKCVRRGAVRGFSACFARIDYSASAPHSSTFFLLLLERASYLLYSASLERHSHSCSSPTYTSDTRPCPTQDALRTVKTNSFRILVLSSRPIREWKLPRHYTT